MAPESAPRYGNVSDRELLLRGLFGTHQPEARDAKRAYCVEHELQLLSTS